MSIPTPSELAVYCHRYPDHLIVFRFGTERGTLGSGCGIVRPRSWRFELGYNDHMADCEIFKASAAGIPVLVVEAVAKGD